MALCRAEIAHLVSSLICCLFETFRWDLKWDLLFETFETFWNLSCLFETFRWDLKWDLLFETFETFLNLSCLFETFRWDLKWDVLYETFETWNFWNPSWGVAHLKLSDETWNEMCYLKLLKPIMGSCLFETFRWDLKWDVLFETLEPFQPFQIHHKSCLFEIFRWDLKWDVLFEILKLVNLFKPITRAAYLKLSDETWNNIFYLICLKLETFQTCHGSCLFETFRWDLKKNCYLKFLKLVTFQTHHGHLLIWNFQMKLEMRCAIWNFWNLKLLKPIMGSCLFETFRWDLKWDVLFEILKLFNLFKPITRAAYLKLSDETWNNIFYLICLKLETFQTCHGSCLFETFRWNLKKNCYLKFLKLVTFQTHHGHLLIWNFQMRLEMRCAIWNFETWNFWNLSWGVAYLKLSDETWNEMCYLKLLKLETLQFETILSFWHALWGQKSFN